MSLAPPDHPPLLRSMRSAVAIPLDSPTTVRIYLEKVPGRGEDAVPLIARLPNGGRTAVAVFDGLGGAGSGRRDYGGAPHSDAFLASRLAQEVVHGCVLAEDAVDASLLREALSTALTDFADQHPPVAVSALRSRMKQALPTTVAGAIVTPGPAWVDVDLFWAGDSRVYAWTAGGLQLLTRDHTRSFDPLAEGGGDSPMTNMLSASSSFFVADHRVRLDQPAMVIAATDGVFGYVASPVDLERHLRDAAVDADSLRGWAENLATRVAAYTGDDASLAAICVGTTSWAELRRRLLSDEPGRPLDPGRYVALLP